MAKNINRQTTAPLSVPRSNRNHLVQVLSSAKAGVCHPVAFIPMLREDALRAGIRINVEMLETKEILMNATSARITAYLVPLLALERFEGSRDQFDRSYMGEPQYEGGSVVPFIETHAMGAHGSNPVYKAAGLHGKAADTVNTAYLEAYNAVWNFRAKNRSPDITLRTRLMNTLAPAFWQHSRFAHVVPDFDQAVIDGEVALNVTQGKMPVKGFGLLETGSGVSNARLVKTSDGQTQTFEKAWGVQNVDGASGGVGQAKLVVKEGTVAGFPDIYAELAENGVSVSLSNIELARKTQAFAKMRERFEGHDEEYIIDMLMDGLSIPDQALKQPILLADRTVRFGQAKRYATDAGNLAESAVSGAASVDIMLRVPKINTGGVVVVIAEFYPEQLFERQRDPFFHSANVTAWPEYLRDTLDPEKVDVVLNAEVDTDHATPAGVFGYAPMGWKWNASGPKVGGKFYRPSVNTGTDEERQRLWAVEDVNPALSSSFYLVDEIHQKPFLDTAADPFELTASGNAVINGNTVFGGLLVEATNNYDKVSEKAPTDRIVKA